MQKRFILVDINEHINKFINVQSVINGPFIVLLMDSINGLINVL